ncbi:unnamed protein product [Cuscuta epithymum]|uniref:glucan endo-1,3-beta-D-glucosidase n=1 Tax=Cuscuta epithymum TaxID=186058 RepID=A0AAV0CEK8_9ASTE|nr:unnamed protein product [Cuscuta epithymum]
MMGIGLDGAGAAAAFVGVNIGMDMVKRPSATDVVALLKAQQINHVRLFYADAALLRALSHTGIKVVVGVTNGEVEMFARTPSRAARWVNDMVAAPIAASTNITAIAVGNALLTTLPSAAGRLVPAMRHLHKALVSANLSDAVKISTPQSTDIMSAQFPPSAASFNSSAVVREVLEFLESTGSFFMLNAYTYHSYVDSRGVFPVEYALLQPVSEAQRISDPNTGLLYETMLDSLVDATYYAMSALGFRNISVVVAETGWPWNGGVEEPYATVSNAETYNHNLILRVSNGSGTPSRRELPLNAYIYELYNEDGMPGPASARSWGIFFSDGKAVYPLNLSGAGSEGGGSGVNSAAGYCVAKLGVADKDLVKGINWACGEGNTNCSAIRPDGRCYGHTLQSRASYVYNEYYQIMRFCGGSCDFSGTAAITFTPPNSSFLLASGYGECNFTKILNSSASICPPPGSSDPTVPFAEATRIHYPDGNCIIVILLALTFLQFLV